MRCGNTVGAMGVKLVGFMEDTFAAGERFFSPPRPDKQIPAVNIHKLPEVMALALRLEGVFKLKVVERDYLMNIYDIRQLMLYISGSCYTSFQSFRPPF